MPDRAPGRRERPAAASARRDPETVKRVFGEPIELDGVKIIPVATVRRCGHRDAGEENAKGGCSCVSSRPVGLVVIRDGCVSWKPAFDLNRLLLAVAALLGLLLLAGRRRAR